MSEKKMINYFSDREECKKFLKGFDFKYFVPYVDESDLKYKTKRYYIKLNENKNKIEYCGVEKISDGLIWDTMPFYDYKRAWDFQLEQEGEEEHAYYQEMKKKGY